MHFQNPNTHHVLAFHLRFIHLKFDVGYLCLNGTHQLLVYADEVNISGGSIHIVRENTEALLIASKKISLEVNAEKTKYMVMS